MTATAKQGGRAGLAALSALVAESPLEISLLDRDGVFVQVSKGMVAGSSLGQQDFVGRRCEDLFPGTAEQLAVLLDPAAIGTPTKLPVQNVALPDGGQAWIQTTCSPWRYDDGEIGGIICVSQNLTAEQQAREAMQAALAEAETANQAKSAFLATMSHEIRTPLNGVLGMAQAMARDPLTNDQRARLAVIRQSGEALLEILNDILDLSKIEAGRLDLEEIDFDLGGMIQGAASGFAALADQKGLRLVVDTAAAAGTYRGDPNRVRQVIANLISNALKFTDYGEIRVTADPTPQGLEISVSDTGAGIASEVMERLFDKFVQADSSTTRRFGGTGLGLAICRELCELMGGAIAGESAPGHGSCFTVTLPLRRVGAVAPAGPAPAADVAVDTANLRILAAEDNTVNQQVLRTIFEQVGLDVTIVGDGLEAVDAYRRQDWDIILMDIQMPVLDGPEATQAIRTIEAEEGRRRTPIVALTANAMKHQEAAYLAGGMDRLVAKPLNIEALFRVIVELACESAADGESAALSA